jgi:SulP family sulfate permease
MVIAITLISTAEGVALSILLFVPRAAKLKAKELVVTPERVVRERVPGDPVNP